MDKYIGRYNFNDKNVLVAGLGLSGTQVVRVLQEHDVPVITVDEKKDNADYQSFKDINWDLINLIIISPVFSPYEPWVQEALKRHIPIWSEIEFAWRTQATNTIIGKESPWIGITGTNGKTTTTKMIAALFHAAHKKAPAVGNTGVSLTNAAQEQDNDVLCVELSSFELHFTNTMNLDIAVWMNVDQDHLDWHHGFDNYCYDKSKIFNNAQKAIIYNNDDPKVAALAQTAVVGPHCQKIGFTLHNPETGMIGIHDGWVIDKALDSSPEGRKIIALADFNNALKNNQGDVYPHLQSDALAAITAGLVYGLSIDNIKQALSAFHTDRHRLEFVTEVTLSPGEPTLRFIDDSKATNAHATKASLMSFPDHSVIWIAGGLAKGAHFEELLHDCKAKIKAVVLIGKDKTAFLDAIHQELGTVPCISIDDNHLEHSLMEDTVNNAMSFGKPGDTVLLAPAAASMDQFKNMGDRGDQFADAARAWVQQHE